MKFFNGKINILNVTSIDSVNWKLNCSFNDNYSFFTAADAKADDILFVRGENDSSGEQAICMYKVTNSDTSTGSLVLTVTFAETYTDANTIFHPTIGADSMICRMSSSNGFAFISTGANSIPQEMVDYARNIDLKFRDEKLQVYITQAIADGLKNQTSDNTKFNVSGGTITGDTIIQGNLVSQKNVTLGSGDTTASLTSDGIDVKIKSSTPKLSTTITSDSKIDASKTFVSTGNAITNTTSSTGTNVTESDVLNATGSAKITNTINGTSESQYNVTATGASSSINLTSDGTISSKINIASSGNSASEIDLTASSIKVTGNENVSGDLHANKFYQDSTDTTYSDNQLVTSSYLKTYVAANGGSGSGTGINIEVQSALDKKADIDNVYTKTQTDGLLSQVSADHILTNDNYEFVTAAEKTKWSGKQDALGYTAENVANKGVKSGYVPLDENAKINNSFLSLDPTVTKQISYVTSDSFSKITANNYTSKLYIIGTPDTTTNTFKDYCFKGISTDDAGNQSVFELGNLSSTSKQTIPWTALTNIPSNLVYTTNSLLPESLFPLTGVNAGTYNQVTVDTYGRVTMGANPQRSAYEGNTNSTYTLGTKNSDVTIYAETGSTTNPYIKYDIVNKKWVLSNDGTSFTIISGSSGTSDTGVNADVQAALNLKANTSDVYTKTEVDNLITTKTTSYTKAETDALLANINSTAIKTSDAAEFVTAAEKTAWNAKLDAGNVYTKTEVDGLLSKIDASKIVTSASNEFVSDTEKAAWNAKVDASTVYTKTEVDGLITKNDSYTKTEDDALLAAKANVSDVYTKTQTDTSLSSKANTADVYTKTELDTSLALKANAADVYTKTELDTSLAAKANTSDVYGKTDVYTKTEVNTLLSNNTSYTKTETDNLLIAKANSADVTTSLGTKANISDVYTKTEVDGLITKNTSYTKTETDNLLSAKANTTDVTTSLSTKANTADVYAKTEADTLLTAKANVTDVYTKTQIDTSLASKANTADVYTKTEVDTALSSIDASKIKTSDTAEFVTAAEKTAWSGKQDALGYTAENVANKGIAGGYVPLNASGKIDSTYITSSGTTVASDQISYMSATDFANVTTANATSKLYYVGTHDATNNLIDDYTAKGLFTDTDGSKSFVELGKLSESSKQKISWNSLYNVPTNIVYSTSGKIADTLLPVSGATAGTYNQVTVDTYGRVTSGTSVTKSAYEGNTKSAYTFGTSGSDVTLYAETGVAANPYIKYDATNKKWSMSNDGSTVIDLGSSGGSSSSSGLYFYETTDKMISVVATGLGITGTVTTSNTVITIPAGVKPLTIYISLPDEGNASTTYKINFDSTHSITKTAGSTGSLDDYRNNVFPYCSYITTGDIWTLKPVPLTNLTSYNTLELTNLPAIGSNLGFRLQF